MKQNETKNETGAKTDKITVRTLAKMTGYAHCTVARALSNGGNVAEETRLRILQAARESGYVNKTAPAAAIIFPSFGPVLSTYNTTLIDELIKCLEQEKFKYELIPEHMAGNLNETFVNGAISLCYLGTLEKKWAKVNTIPLICLNDYGNHLNRIYSVSSNDRQAMSLVVNHLSSARHLRVVYYEPYSSTKNQRERKVYFYNNAEKAGLEIIPLPRRMRNWGEFVKRNRITAIVIPAEDPDLRIYAELREHGLKIPEDVELVHWFTRKITDTLMPRQYSLSQDFPELAKQAVQMLRRLFHGDKVVSDLFVDYRIVQNGINPAPPPPAHSLKKPSHSDRKERRAPLSRSGSPTAESQTGMLRSGMPPAK